MSNRANAYTEVYTILQDLNTEEYNKIPPEIIKAILFNLFRDYLATSEQKEKIIKMQNEGRQKSGL